MSNQLDNFFKNKLKQRSFEYKDSAWEEARLLIERDERNKKRRRFVFIFTSAALLLLVGFSAFYMGKNSSNFSETPTKSVPIEQEISKPQIIAQNTNSEIQAPTIERITTKDLKPNVNLADNTLKTKTVIENTILAQAKTTNKNNIDYTNNKNTTSNLGIAQGVAKNNATIYKPTSTDSNPYTVAQATPKLSDINTFKNNKFRDLSQLPFTLIDELQKSDENNIIDLDEFLPPLKRVEEGNPIAKAKSRWSFGIRAAAGLIPFDFMDFEAGIEFGYLINRNWSLAFQPKYQYQQLTTNSVSQSEIQEFGFGLRTSAFSLNAEAVRSIHFPLLVSFSFGNKGLDLTDDPSKRFLRNKLSVGAAYVYLDGITGSILQKEAAGNTSEFQSGWLSDESFNRHNAELILSYDRFLSKRWSLGLQARYRVRDQFSDTFDSLNPNVIAPGAFYLGLQTNFKLF